MKEIFDVIVVGGGHAGVEAACAAAKMGSKTILLTLDVDKVATMPCNPSIGGLGKGHIVFEISALGGLMPQLCSKTYLQARMLNTSKGPAVQGLRLQIDKYAYSSLAKEYLLNTPNLSVESHAVTELLAHNGAVRGVRTDQGREFYAPSVVITTGTFLNGLMHIGRTRYKAGRRGEQAVYGLSASLGRAMGVPIARLKTGTPPRLRTSTIDYTQLEKQPNEPLEYLYEFDPVQVTEKIPCYVTMTNEKTHDIIRNNLHLSALYSGNIKGIGPRYCPSIEDKVGRYPDRTSHHIFIEPEGLQIDEVYPAGLSTSLPLEVQKAYIQSIKGLENAVITKCGYAIEYDFIQPTNLTSWLEAKTVQGLFLAGQINGTTGYEEAAGQGLIAGINAHLKHSGKEPFVVSRNESYIGVMIDDLVTLGADEPYRMFTSRAERRLLLRQDNVFLRLMPYGHQLGLIDDALYQKFLGEKESIERGVALVRAAGTSSMLFKIFHGTDFTQETRSSVKQLMHPLCAQHHVSTDDLSARVLLGIHAEIKYDGYLDKERREVEKTQRYQGLKIPLDFVYKDVPGLSKELQQKLNFYRPASIAHAQLIPGMTPAAISVLIFQVRMREKQ
ncbi:MAG: tRNA uridine-5-carboxymethylaminomethyl(34) synthesis enzyme MnmG [Candidatus Babeliales bacterium]|jgi:tRNA uridine 5-carboxymethylaminomethyl modification enzyme